MRISPPRLLIEIVAGIVAILVLVVGAIVARLASGPLELDWLVPMVEAAVEQESPGLTLRIGGTTALVWGGQDQISLLVRDLNLGQGGSVLAVPELSLTFDPLALLGGTLQPRSAVLKGAKLSLTREPNGDWVWSSVAGDPATSTLPPEITLGSFEHLALSNATIDLSDRRSGLTVALSDVSADWRRRDGVWRATVAGTATAEAIDAQVTLGFEPVPEGIAVIGQVTLAAAQPAAVVALARRLEMTPPAWIEAIGGRIGGDVEGSGVYGPTNKVDWISVDLKAADVTLPPALTEGATVEARDLVARIGWQGDWIDVEATARGLRVAAADLPAGPLEDVTLRVTARSDTAGQEPTTASLRLTGPGLNLEVKGQGRQSVAGLDATLNIQIVDLPVDDLKRIWPASVGPNPRRWILANLAQGSVSAATATLRLVRVGNAGPIEVIGASGSIEAAGVRVTYAPRLPPVERAVARATFTEKAFDIAISSGALRRLRIGGGRIQLTGLDATEQWADIDLTVTGPITDALAVLDLPPLGFISRFGLNPATVGGDHRARLGFRFPLIDRLTFDDIAITAEADLRALSIPKPLLDLDVSQGELKLKLDQNGLTLQGTALLADLPLNIGWTESFRRAAQPRRRVDLAATLDAVQRARLGIVLPDAISGPIRANAVYQGEDGGRGRIAAVLDLRETRLSVPDFGFEKPVGMPTEARFDVSLAGDRPVAIDGLRFTAGAASATGRGRFAPDGRLDRLDIDRVRVGGSDLSLSVQRRGESWQIGVAGARLDLIEAVKRAEQKPTGQAVVPEGPPGPAIGVEFQVASVRISPQVGLENLQGRIDWDGRRVAGLRLVGQIGGSGLEAVMVPSPEGRDVALKSADAGATLRALDVTDSVRGGVLNLTGRLVERGAETIFDGQLRIDDVRVVGAPMLSRLLQLASITGIPELLGGEGVLFQRITASIQRTDAKVEIKAGRAAGLALGIELHGIIDRVRETMDLAGTLVPLNTFNRVLGAIPLLGDLLTGGGVGLFAFTFSIRGPTADPELSINPLSVLAPSFLRQLFEYTPVDTTVPPVRR